MSTRLPEPFRDLEPYMKWGEPTMIARLTKRLASDFSEISAYYDAMLPRIEAVLVYLDQFPLDDMPDDAKLLLNMSLSFADAISCVEYYGSNRIPKGCEHERFPLVYPTHVT